MTEKELLELKEDIEEAKTLVSESKGKLQLLKQQLTDSYQCPSTERAKRKEKLLQEEIQELQERINKATAKLEDKLDEQNTTTSE